ncbi:MAG TPA: hypothetical protein V6D34_02870 [Candidatus Sericytochromatia bacterium]
MTTALTLKYGVMSVTRPSELGQRRALELSRPTMTTLTGENSFYHLRK